MKKLDTKQIVDKLKPYLQRIQRYHVIIFIIVLVSVYALLVLRINTLNSREPNDDDVTAQLQTVRQPKLDPDVVNKIQQLKDNSSNVQALFNQARDNPFQE